MPCAAQRAAGAALTCAPPVALACSQHGAGPSPYSAPTASCLLWACMPAPPLAGCGSARELAAGPGGARQREAVILCSGAASTPRMRARPARPRAQAHHLGALLACPAQATTPTTPRPPTPGAGAAHQVVAEAAARRDGHVAEAQRAGLEGELARRGGGRGHDLRQRVQHAQRGRVEHKVARRMACQHRAPAPGAAGRTRRSENAARLARQRPDLGLWEAWTVPASPVPLRASQLACIPAVCCPQVTSV